MKLNTIMDIVGKKFGIIKINKHTITTIPQKIITMFVKKIATIVKMMMVIQPALTQMHIRFVVMKRREF